jgi:hypothetical protein
MKKLETTIKKNAFEYVQVNRNDVYAIYAQFYNGVLIGHEVFKINKYEEREIPGVKIPAHEAMPGDNQFGVTAWSTGKDYNRALDKYNELCLKPVKT